LSTIPVVASKTPLYCSFALATPLVARCFPVFSKISAGDPGLSKKRFRSSNVVAKVSGDVSALTKRL